MQPEGKYKQQINALIINNNKNTDLYYCIHEVTKYTFKSGCVLGNGVALTKSILLTIILIESMCHPSYMSEVEFQLAVTSS